MKKIMVLNGQEQTFRNFIAQNKQYAAQYVVSANNQSVAYYAAVDRGWAEFHNELANIAQKYLTSGMNLMSAAGHTNMAWKNLDVRDFIARATSGIAKPNYAGMPADDTL